jgi:hypothetical protein
MLNFILFLLILAFVLVVTKSNHMWGSTSGARKAKEDAQKLKQERKSRDFRLRCLKFFAGFSNFGTDANPAKIHEYDYQLTRIGKPIKYVDRVITATELYGLLKFIAFAGVVIALFGLILTSNPIFLIFLAGLFSGSLFSYFATSKIVNEDAQIEKEFPDLYLLLYSRLLNGAHTRLAPTLDDYLASLEYMYGTDGNPAMEKFVTTFRNYIEVYGDDCMAVKKLREVYQSSMIVNFCNLAVQALNNVNNSDKLLAFKIELSQKRMEQMTAEAKKRVEKGQRMIWLIFIILGEFIVLSWAAKLGGSFSFTSMF